MIYGTTNFHLVRDLTDLIGIRTLILRQYWQPDIANPSQADIDAFSPAVPAVPGGLMLMGDQTIRERGRYATYWTFQGINGDGKGTTFKDRKNTLDYGFESGFAQLPIQLHPEFAKMKEKFQGYPSNDGSTVIWPPELSPSNGGINGGGLVYQPDRPSELLNPMFGISAFFAMEGIYRCRYAERELPENLDEGVGFIASDVPGKPHKTREGRNFLKAPTVWVRKGVVFDITEYYWLSQRGGWPEPLYRKGYFQS